MIPSFTSAIAAELVEAKLSQENVGLIFVSVQEAPSGICSWRTTAKIVLVSPPAIWRQNNYVNCSDDQLPWVEQEYSQAGGVWTAYRSQPAMEEGLVPEQMVFPAHMFPLFLLVLSKIPLFPFVFLLPPGLLLRWVFWASVLFLTSKNGSHQSKWADHWQSAPHTKLTKDISPTYSAAPCSGLSSGKGPVDREEIAAQAKQVMRIRQLIVWRKLRMLAREQVESWKYGRLLLQLHFWQLCDCHWLRARYMTGTNSYLEEQQKGNTLYFTYNLTHHNQIC